MTIGCAIRALPEQGMLRLEAVVTVRQAASGSYKFEVSKQGPAGTSRNVQSGTFDKAAGQDTLLTTVILDGTARGHYRARLSLDSEEFGSISCVSP